MMNKRDRLIEAAADLFHHSGMASTSLADIAKHADIPIGNVYYYFKTKEELAMAALEKRKTMLEQAYKNLDETLDDPRERLMEAVRFFDAIREEYTRFGCPIGKIIADSNVQKDNVAKAASKVFGSFVDWAERQFAQLGHADQAQVYAVSLMAGIQGASTMAKAFQEPRIMQNEINRLLEWLASIPNKRIFLGKAGIKAAEPVEAA